MAPIEYVGILATLFVLVSFTSSNRVFIRTVNSIGSVLFVIYGLNLGAHSVWILNSAVIVVNLYKLYKERKQSKV